MQFWYRQSPRPLAPQNLGGRVAWSDPPQLVAGMAGASYDLRGRLVSFYVVPPQLEQAKRRRLGGGRRRRAGLGAALRGGALEPSGFRRAEPLWTPPFYVDTRVAWEGRWPARPDLPLRIEAASYRGRPVWFEIRNAWTRAEREQSFVRWPRASAAMQTFSILLLVALVGAGCVLAYRNISLGRGDRQGAFRLALALATLWTVGWALRAHHVADPMGELTSAARGMGFAVLVAAIVWLFYLALEPYVRRLRPWTLVSWTRLLNGGWRDAVVGPRRAGTGWPSAPASCSCACSRARSHALLGSPEPPPTSSASTRCSRRRSCWASSRACPSDAVLHGLAVLLLFLILRLATRRDWIAAVLIAAFLVAADLIDSRVSRESLWLFLLIATAAQGVFVALLLRLGVLAAIACIWTADMLVGPSLLYNSRAAGPARTSTSWCRCCC